MNLTELANLAKKSLKSRTIWVSGLTTAAGVLTYLQGDQLIASNPKAASLVLAALGVVGVVLRYLTTEAISEK